MHEEAFSVEQIVALLKQAQLGVPVGITLDGYPASHRSVHGMPTEDQAWNHTKLRSSKYPNNLIEQDHRDIKSRPGLMLGFNDFDYAATTIAGIELLRRIRKGQFALGRLGLRSRTVPAIWNAVLAASSLLLLGPLCATRTSLHQNPHRNIAQKNRSESANHGCGRLCFKTASCCRSSKFFQAPDHAESRRSGLAW